MSKLPKKLQEQVSESNFVDLSEAEKIAANYAPLMNAVNEQIKILKTLEVGNIEHLAIAKRVRLDLGKICSKNTAQKINDKDLILIKSRFIDGLFNTVNGAARITQEEAKELELHFERIEEQRVEELKNNRLNQLAAYIDVEDSVINVLDLGNMQDDVWDAYLASKKVEKEKAEAEAKQAELDRIKREEEEAAERKRVEAENKRIAEQNKKLLEDKKKLDAKLAKEKQEREAKELEEAKKRQEKERKEREAHEAQLKKEREEKAEVERKAEEQRKKLQAEIDKKNKEEEDRVAEEKRKKEEEANRKEAELSKGDEDKVKDLIADLLALTHKYEFKSAKNKKTMSGVVSLINKIVAFINEQTNEK